MVIGEGGSGGALGIGVGDRVAMLRALLLLGDQPGGLCRDPLEEPRVRRTQAADVAAIHFPGSLRIGVVDDVIHEPLGGAHRDHHQMAQRVKLYLLKSLRELTGADGRAAARRYEKFRRMGIFLEGDQADLAGVDSDS